MPTILAIESSCDETSASICVDAKVLNNIIATQEIHHTYGGVVPELASRAHIENIVPTVNNALEDFADKVCDNPFENNSAKINYALSKLDAIAFTQSPGLVGSLLVGCQFAKSLALALNKPLIAVHHMQAHVLANLIAEQQPQFPFLCLTVSGGHTQIVIAHTATRLEIIGQTIDDAAGEAFDKTAKLLGLPYPGGPLIDKYAQDGNPTAFKFAEPQIADLDFSFSGLKTSVLYFLQKQTAAFITENMNDLCASIQHTICNILIKKMHKGIVQTGIKQICLAGGVSANKGLRKRFEELGVKMQCQTFIPSFEYCTDNAAMIAITAHYKYLEQDFATLDTNPSARSDW
ncbi:MAG: tRNA (adenosine(37)-N6)-threonylcarbamoyltransferase complex transferase subunit TsaD [Bacteroidetes bacterium]|nr:tRNA (adenosine(37)-N6)-threonylcarbamoyltransferase complex transferase subunit TsaD [Bacteroidota bacterium]